MSRIAKPQMFSSKVYRHFAVITIAVTACIGLFADGENTEAVRSRIEERQSRNHVLKAEAEKLGARRLTAGKLHLRDEKRAYVAFAPDASSDVRDDSGGVSINTDDDFRPQRRSGVPVTALQAPVGPPMLAPGTPGGIVVAPRRRPAVAAPKPPTAAEIEAMLEASRARSGSAGRE